VTGAGRGGPEAGPWPYPDQGPPRREVSLDGLPAWLHPVVEAARTVRADELSRFLPDTTLRRRRGAVLILFGESPGDGGPVPDLLIIERSYAMRSHAGQPAFPGGAVDPDDDGPVAAALREAAEETGLDPSGVRVVTTLPELWLPPSDFLVTPVLGYWERPSPVWVVDPTEVESVHRIPLDELLDPANRLMVQHPSGFRGPAFTVRGLLVWGFTGGLLARLLQVAGLERPWDTERVTDLPPEQLRAALRSAAHPGFVAGTSGGEP
jgi:8-oxo-dGTP pyrophosphatase MutT (NUDIX family)